jgi:hypothetical protein
MHGFAHKTVPVSLLFEGIAFRAGGEAARHSHGNRLQLLILPITLV